MKKTVDFINSSVKNDAAAFVADEQKAYYDWATPPTPALAAMVMRTTM